MGKHPLKPQMMEAVMLRLDGLSLRQIAERLNVTHATIRNWQLREDVNEYYNEQLKQRAHRMFNKACSRLERQIDDDNPWIAQNAARDALNKYGGMVMGEDKQEIVVHIAGGMPDIGMPERSEED